MVIAVLTVTLRASWSHSLKDKRAVIKSLLAKIRNKFNVSAAETDAQDDHQILVITIASIAADHTQGDSIMDTILIYIEEITDAEVVGVDRDFR